MKKYALIALIPTVLALAACAPEDGTDTTGTTITTNDMRTPAVTNPAPVNPAPAGTDQQNPPNTGRTAPPPPATP